VGVATSTEVSPSVLVEHCGGAELGDAAVTVAVYARYAGVTYIDMAHTSRHSLNEFDTCSISNVIDSELLRADIDGCLCVRVFVCPLQSL